MTNAERLARLKAIEAARAEINALLPPFVIDEKTGSWRTFDKYQSGLSDALAIIDKHLGNYDDQR